LNRHNPAKSAEMDYRAVDDVYFELIQEQATPMFARIATTKFPQTYRALFSFCARTNALKTAMFDMIDSDNPYAFNALLRCFWEHYLKFTYVFVRFLLERSDTPGHDYFAFCGAREMRQYGGAIVEAEKLLGNEVVAQYKGFLEKHFPVAAHLSPSELKQESAKFEYRSILKFLSQHPRILGPENTALAPILPMYARLSSFVHGGPASERETHSYAGDEALKTCKKDAELVFVMTASMVKEPPSQTFAFLLQDLYEIPGEFVACLEWQRIASDRMRRDVQSRRRHFFNKRVSIVNYVSPESLAKEV
jgi:hypothetical protein